MICLWILLCGFGIGVYLLPSFIASYRGLQYRRPVFILNIFLGFTLLGYVGALLWACWPDVDRLGKPDQQNSFRAVKIWAIVIGILTLCGLGYDLVVWGKGQYQQYLRERSVWLDNYSQRVSELRRELWRSRYDEPDTTDRLYFLDLWNRELLLNASSRRQLVDEESELEKEFQRLAAKQPARDQEDEVRALITRFEKVIDQRLPTTEQNYSVLASLLIENANRWESTLSYGRQKLEQWHQLNRRLGNSSSLASTYSNPNPTSYDLFQSIRFPSEDQFARSLENAAQKQRRMRQLADELFLSGKHKAHIMEIGTLVGAQFNIDGIDTRIEQVRQAQQRRSW